MNSVTFDIFVKKKLNTFKLLRLSLNYKTNTFILVFEMDWTSKKN